MGAIAPGWCERRGHACFEEARERSSLDSGSTASLVTDLARQAADEDVANELFASCMQGINPRVNVREAYMRLVQRVDHLQELHARLLDILTYYVWLHEGGHQAFGTQGELREYLIKYPLGRTHLNLILKVWRYQSDAEECWEPKRSQI